MRNEAKYARSKDIVAGTCDLHRKRRYLSRKAANRVVKRHHPGQKMDAFRCDENDNYWHIGHLSRKGVQ